MNVVEAALARATSDLESLGSGYALVGGFAVSVYADPRMTRDVDLAVAVESDAAAEALVRELVAKGYAIVALVEQYGADRLGTARLSVPGPGVVLLDLLFASSGIESEVVDGSRRLTVLPGLEVPVASVGHLISLKLLARDDETRPQDLPDLRALKNVAAPEDERVALAAAHLVTARGYDRGRDLVALTEEFFGGS